MTAMNKIFSLKESFDWVRVFSVVMQNVSDDTSIPAIFIRFIIQVIQASPGNNIDVFIADVILPKLCNTVCLDDSTQWRGLSMVLCLLMLSTDTGVKRKACETSCSLPFSKTVELISRKSELKAVLREFIVQQPASLYSELRRILLE
jgi:hypothetical protein